VKDENSQKGIKHQNVKDEKLKRSKGIKHQNVKDEKLKGQKV